jgi:hypothetical protein
MKKLNFLLRSEIKDIDLIDNICEDTKAILIDKDKCWIEISDNGFFVPCGLSGVRTKDILKARAALIKFKIDNEIF